MLSRSVSGDIVARTRAVATMIAEEMGYASVLCIEFFVLQDSSLVTSEMTPCPHNSGHTTTDVCETSQSEQQVRAMAHLSLDSMRQHSLEHVLNVLNDVWFEYDLERTLAQHEMMSRNGAKVHLHSEANARPDRKVSHVNYVGTSAEVVGEVFRHAVHVLDLQPK